MMDLLCGMRTAHFLLGNKTPIFPLHSLIAVTLFLPLTNYYQRSHAHSGHVVLGQHTFLGRFCQKYSYTLDLIFRRCLVSVSDIQFDECLDLWFPVKTVSVEEEESAELHVLLYKSIDPDAVLYLLYLFSLPLSVLFI